MSLAERNATQAFQMQETNTLQLGHASEPNSQLLIDATIS